MFILMNAYLCITILFLITSCDSRCLTLGNLYNSTSIGANTSTLVFPPLELNIRGYFGCQKECLLNAFCKTLRFDPKHLKCWLYQLPTNEVNFVAFEDQIIINRSNIVESNILEALDPCAQHNCPSPKRCVKLTSGESRCQSACANQNYTLLDPTINFCVKIYLDSISFNQSQKNCEKDGATLDVLNSVQKLNKIKNEINLHGSYWIGLLLVNGIWTWSTGETNTHPMILDSGDRGVWYKKNINDDFENRNYNYICEEVYI